MLKAILQLKCPRCRQGHLFQTQNHFNLKKFDKMNAQCDKCGLRTEPEPGFYYGAMYVSYAFGVAIFVFNFILLEVILKVPGMLWFISVNTLMLIGLWTVMFRYARIIYLNFFVSYKPDANS